jgi:hypothetical protein
MFNLNLFIKSGLLKAIGKMADYQIILNAAGWFDKGVLIESDLAEIHAAIEANNVQIETSEEEIEETEEVSEETSKEIPET